MALMPFLIIIKKKQGKKQTKKPNQTKQTKKKTVIDALWSWEFELLSYCLGVWKDLQ